MTRTYLPRTARTPYPTWWLRHGGWVLLALLAAVSLLPLPSIVHAVASGVVLGSAIRIHAAQAAYRAARRNGGAS